MPEPKQPEPKPKKKSGILHALKLKLAAAGHAVNESAGEAFEDRK